MVLFIFIIQIRGLQPLMYKVWDQLTEQREHQKLFRWGKAFTFRQLLAEGTLDFDESVKTNYNTSTNPLLKSSNTTTIGAVLD